MEQQLQKESNRDYNSILVRYGEIGLKQGNRGMFEDMLLRNIRKQLDSRGIGYNKVYKISGRFVIDSPNIEAARVAAKVFGVSSTSPAIKTAPEIEAIKKVVLSLFKKASPTPKTFRITSRRLVKNIKSTSTEINAAIGEYIVNETGGKVKLDDPELEVFIDLTTREAFVHIERFNGLPVGVSGKVAVLLSGGIDSPVAAWLCMRRGCAVTLVHFLHGKNTDKPPQKILEIHKKLKEYHPEIDLICVPMDCVEREIIMNVPSEYRIIILRRVFMRIAGKICDEKGFSAIASGDNIGQVASQTIENTTAIEEACSRMWIRPLTCANKEEIIDLAKKIGTYELSIQEHSDCCSFMVPKHPVTNSKLVLANEYEKRISPEKIEEAYRGSVLLE